MTKEEKLLFGERLRELRTKKWMTQEETAERLNISLRYYQMLERGENVGSVDLLLQISGLFHCSIDYLLLGTVSASQSDPLVERLNQLTAKQRTNLTKLIELWMDSTKPDR